MPLANELRCEEEFQETTPQKSRRYWLADSKFIPDEFDLNCYYHLLFKRIEKNLGGGIVDREGCPYHVNSTVDQGRGKMFFDKLVAVEVASRK